MKPASIIKWAVVFGLFLLVLPLLVRFSENAPLMPGSEGYGHARIAAIIAQKGIPAYDPAMPERAYVPNVFDLTLAGFAKALGIEAASAALPLLLGILSLLCIWQAVRKWKIPQGTAAGIMIVFMLSPLFVDVFTQAVPRSLELFLLSLFLLVISPAEKERSTKATILFTIAAFIVAGLLATFGIFTAIAAFALPMLLRKINKRVQPQMMFASLAALISLVVFALPKFLQSEPAVFAKPTPVVQAVSDFGGAGGLSLFAWLLAFIGLALLWQFKKKYYSAMIGVGITLVAALITPSALVPAQILIAFLAGYALAFFAQMKWAFDDIRVLTVLVLVCGLLFSTLNHDIALARGNPSIALRSGAISLALPKDSVVLAYPDDAFWLEYWSGHQALLDSWASQTPRANARWALAQEIWHSQDISRLRPLLYKNNIGAIVVTKEMRSGLVWDLPEEGLLFLLRNSETFKNVHHSSSVDIWTVLPPGK
jgi:hypothetical protein